MAVDQNICPICTAPFKKGEVIVQYLTWNGDQGQSMQRLGHMDCALYLSRQEDRNHPPS